MADTRTLSITLGSGNFNFVDLVQEKTIYAAGEAVRVTYRVRNVGNILSGAKIDVFDKDANTVIRTFTIPTLEIWSTFTPTTYLAEGVSIGSMPSHDWNLEFRLTP
ncbi:hypothetical protein MUP59_02020 [Candidatus Bathyarchaeota archaeon]|nr:hypothetical protein [Candidatus Bathyarchaeota archaeon]